MVTFVRYLIITEHTEHGCKEGEIPLSETRKCKSGGYTCHLNDGAGCCNGRQEEKRQCVPCDETYLKKSSGYYNRAGSCDYVPGTRNHILDLQSISNFSPLIYGVKLN